jgi:3',5'-cyclic AMP phosphodiesterase CpdA
MGPRQIAAAFAALAALATLLASGCGYVPIDADAHAGAALASPVLPASPKRPPFESFSFVHMADPQLFWGADSLERWEGAIAVMNRLRPDFVVVGGDLTNAHGDLAKRDAAEAERMASAYLDAAKELDPAVALRNVAGNHDVGNTPAPESYAWYEERFGKPWYSFAHKGVLFVVLETNVLKHPERLPGMAEKQLAWLEGSLRGARGERYRHRIVFMHHPFCMKTIDEKECYENLSVMTRVRLLTIFEEHGVDAIFSGHFHGNRTLEVGGIECVITTAVAKSLRGGPPGFRIVKVTPGGVEHSFHSWDDAPERLP